MRARRLAIAFTGALATGAFGSAGLVARAAPPSFATLANQVFPVTNLGPNHDTSCDIYYDLYTPNDASASHQVPAILTTNGFGGSKNSQVGQAQLWASHDYEVLSYSGLGFGGSTCQIYADDVDWDGRAASQLVDWLGSSAHPEIIKDAPGDPRIGTWGGSYGGGFQFALAAASNKIDAMVPEITWNDLTYSLAPNNNNSNFTYDYNATAVGAQKTGWSALFYALGNAEPTFAGQTPDTVGYSGWINTTATAAHNPRTGTPPNPACPGYEMLICTETTKTLAEGYPSAAVIARLQHASAQYALAPFSGSSGHFPPALLIQGETDTLFDLNDAIANYRLWQAKGAPVKMVFKSGGHSGPDGAGEYNNTDPGKGYLTLLALNWFDHYLKKLSVDTGPGLEYFQDWVKYDHNGSAQAAFASAPSYPVGSTLTLYLSGGNSMTGTGDLVGKVSQVKAGSITFTNGAPGTSYSDTPIVSQDQQPPATDPTGQYASFSTGALTGDVDVVGVPMADFTISDANPVSRVDPSLEVQLFAKIYDVAPDGSKALVHRLVSAVRVPDTSKPVHINLPGVVHRYLKGHSINFLIATTDATYQTSRATHVLTISPDPAHPATVTVPVLGGAVQAQNLIPAPTSVTSVGGQLPNSSAERPGWLGVWLVLAGIAGLLFWQRPRRHPGKPTA